MTINFRCRSNFISGSLCQHIQLPVASNDSQIQVLQNPVYLLACILTLFQKYSRFSLDCLQFHSNHNSKTSGVKVIITSNFRHLLISNVQIQYHQEYLIQWSYLPHGGVCIFKSQPGTLSQCAGNAIFLLLKFD